MRQLGAKAAIPVFGALVALLSGIVLAGCIVSDDVTTITIRPDGAADVVLFRSNLVSNESGAKAEQELRDYVAAFDARRDSDLTRLVAAGGEIVDARWIRREAPCSNVVVAKLPSAAALEKYLTISSGPQGAAGGSGPQGAAGGSDPQGAAGQGGDELRVETRFTAEGDRRRLAIVLLPPKPFELPAPASVKALRQEQADGISETRLAVVDGEIVSARGFTIAKDRKSALLALAEIAELLRADPRRVELELVWQVRAR